MGSWFWGEPYTEAKMSASPQFAGARKVYNRADHIWTEIYGEDGLKRYLCCLCGGITANPPNYPTPADWLPELGYRRLLQSERDKAPVSPGNEKTPKV